MAKREYDESDHVCGNCWHHRPVFEDGEIAGWECMNEHAENFALETEYGDGEECPDFESKR
jgi:hypothetical protein